MRHINVQVAGTDAAAPARPAAGPVPSRRLRPPDSESLWWLAAVSAAFTCAQLLFVRLHGLSWDEVVYVSQVSGRIPAAPFDPARARGIPLLVAPVALLTSSLTALRAYLAVASGAALFCSLLAWRRLRPGSMLALAGLFFAGLWVVQYYGPQAMPDEWLAFCALAATGLFVRAAGPDGGPTRIRLAGLAAVIAAAALIRPGDAVFLVGALLAAALVVPSWRRWPVLVTVVAGAIAGAAEWIAEAYVRFGGPLERLHLASAEQGGFGLRPGLWAELRAVNGPTLCRPCTIGWRYPVLSLWWLALPVLVLLGILAARHAGRGRMSSSVLAAACALALAAQYLAGIGYAAPRFLIPAYALAAIPVADLVAWIIARTRPGAPAERTGMKVLIGLVVVVQLIAQHAVLERQVADTAALHDDYAKVAADLHRLGVRGRCLINGAQRIPVAFYAGCASAPQATTADPPGSARFAILEWRHSRPPSYARHWPRYRLTGTGYLRLTAFVRPHRQPAPQPGPAGRGTS